MFLFFFTINALLSFADFNANLNPRIIEKTKNKECREFLKVASDGCNFDTLYQCRVKKKGKWTLWKTKHVTSTKAYCVSDE